MEVIKTDNIVRFQKGKKGIIAHNDNGKIILSKNKSVKEGYYKLSNIEEKDNVILADAQRVPYDYFPDITYNEFLNVLKFNDCELLRLVEVGASCFNHYCTDHDIRHHPSYTMSTGV